MLGIRSLFCGAALCWLLLGCVWPGFAQEGKPLATFTVKELFGVAHPDQIIDFDLRVAVDAKNRYLIGPNGQEVSYQLLEGGKKLAVRTGLPACRYPVPVEWTWTLYTGRAPARVTDGVVVTRTPTAYEISNGVTGVRVPQSPATSVTRLATATTVSPKGQNTA